MLLISTWLFNYQCGLLLILNMIKTKLKFGCQFCQEKVIFPPLGRLKQSWQQARNKLNSKGRTVYASTIFFSAYNLPWGVSPAAKRQLQKRGRQLYAQLTVPRKITRPYYRSYPYEWDRQGWFRFGRLKVATFIMLTLCLNSISISVRE